MNDPLRVGTRGSPLARAQTGLVIAALQRRWPETRFETVPIVTQGDRRPAAEADLDFTDRIDRELEEGGIDLAVHSAKDLPGRSTRSVRIAAYPPRADARDCVVLRAAGRLAALPPGSRLGSSSVRRRAQLLRWRSDLTIVPVRGNVGTRLELLRGGGLDGVVLAVAGLARLGLADRISEVLSVRRLLPAPGQGALAVAVRASNGRLARRIAAIDHLATRRAATAERAVLAALGGDCDVPLGAYATVRGDRLRLRAVLLAPDGTWGVARAVTGRPEAAARLGTALGAALARARTAPGGPARDPA